MYPDSTRVDGSSQRAERPLVTAESASASIEPGVRSSLQGPSPQSVHGLGNTTSNRSGYFGPTSHDSIFEETRFSLSLQRGLPLPSESSADVGDDNRRHVTFHDLPRPLRETCLEVLRCLPGQINAQIEISPGASEPRGWAYLAVDRIIRSLQETYDDVLKEGEPGLESFAETLCNNTTRPINDGHNLQQWLDQFCGQNLRWESIGLLWAHTEHVSDIVDSLQPRRLYWINGKDSPEQGHTFLQYCIDIARKFTAGNDLLLDLARRSATLASVVDGDAGKLLLAALWLRQRVDMMHKPLAAGALTG